MALGAGMLDAQHMPRFVLQLGTQLSLTARRTQRQRHAACSMARTQNGAWARQTEAQRPFCLASAALRLRLCGSSGATGVWRRGMRQASIHAIQS